MARKACCRCGRRPQRDNSGSSYCDRCDSMLAAVRYFNAQRALLGEDWARDYLERKEWILAAVKAAHEGKRIPL